MKMKPVKMPKGKLTPAAASRIMAKGQGDEMNRRRFFGLLAAAPVAIAAAPAITAELPELARCSGTGTFNRNAFALCAPLLTLDKWLEVEFEWDDYEVRLNPEFA